jgi:hypothetical protein
VRLCAYIKHLLPSTDIRRFCWLEDGIRCFSVTVFWVFVFSSKCLGAPKQQPDIKSAENLRENIAPMVVAPTPQDCESWVPTWPPAQPEALLYEMSGIVQSTLDKSLLYHITDSGNDPMIVVTDFAGKIQKKVRYRGAAWDVEALSKGPCPWGGVCIFPGDIGDNLRWRMVKRIDAVEEKSLFGGAMRAESIEFKLPEQLILDMEALAVHPLTGDIFLFSKESKGSRVFRLSARVWQKLDTVHEPEYVGEISQNMVSDAAFSRDGRRILLTATKGIFERSEEPRWKMRRVGGWYPYERDLGLPRLDQQEGVTYLDDDRSVAYSSEKKILRYKDWGIVTARCQAYKAGD